MNGPGRPTVDLARRLLEREAEGRTDPLALSEATHRTFDQMHGLLVRLVGHAGFEMLLSRALTRAARTHEYLEGVPSGFDGRAFLDGLGEAVRHRDGDEVMHGLSEAVAEFIGLLVRFIGEEMTIRLLSRCWPDAGLETLRPGSERGANE